MEAKDLKVSKFQNDELLEAQNMVSGFLKYLNSEFENIKKMEADKS